MCLKINTFEISANVIIQLQIYIYDANQLNAQKKSNE